MNRKPFVHSGRNLLFIPAWRFSSHVKISGFEPDDDTRQCDIK